MNLKTHHITSANIDPMQEKINVLQVIGYMDRAGAETMLMNILRNIDRDTYKFIFLCFGNRKFDYEDEIIQLGGEIRRIPGIKKGGIFKNIYRMIRIIRQDKIDILQAHIYYESVFSLIAARLSGVKVRITHSHNTKWEETPSLSKRLYVDVAKPIINHLSTAYFACGQDAGEALFYKRNAFTIIDNGIILRDFYFDKFTRDTYRKKLKLPKNCITFLHVGRFDEQKNHTLLIDIYAEYQKINQNSRLILVGDGVLRANIENKVAELELQSKVTFLGKRSDVNKLYNAADMFLFPSLFEGLPVTMIEAQANGLMCLVSNTIDRTTKLTDCVEFHSLSDSASHWAQQIDKLNFQHIDTKTDLEGSNYNISNNIKKIEKLYKDMLN